MHAYARQFNALSRYATHHVDTDAKKRERFQRGLNHDLKERLVLHSGTTFNDLVSSAIKVEDAMQHSQEYQRKKRAASSDPKDPSPKYRLVYNSPTGQQFSPNQARQQWSRRPQPPRPQQQQRNFTGPAYPPKPNSTGGPTNHVTCFNCGKQGHYSKECPLKKDTFQKPRTDQASSQVKSGRVNFTSAVLAGMFSLLLQPISFVGGKQCLDIVTPSRS